MKNSYKYRLTLVPTDGPTIDTETSHEWSMGYTFKVLFSSFPAFRTNSFITKADVDAQCWHHHNGDSVFDVSFRTISHEEVAERKAATNHAYSEAYYAGKRSEADEDMEDMLQRLIAKEW